MRLFYRILVLLGMFLPLTAAFGDDDSSVELNKIIVTPSRIEEVRTSTPYKVDLLNGTELRQSYPEDLGAALESLPSVNVSDYGGFGQAKTIRMRGATGSQVLVMVDGRPLNSPRDGEVDLSTIPLAFVDRVEVVHGPGSSLYGSAAMGGIVNVITKNPPKQPKTQLTTLAGNHGTVIERVSHGASAGNFGYIINGEYGHTDGFRENSVTDTNSADGKITYTLNESNKLRLSSGYFNSRTGTPGLASAPDKDDHQLDQKNFVDAGWDFDAGEGLSFLTRTYRNYERLRFFENSAGSSWDIAGDKFRHTTVSNGLSTQATKEFTDSYTATTGFDYTGNFNNSTSTGKHDYNVRAGYLQNILSVTERVKVNFGARLDDYSTFGTKVNPNAGAVYSFNDTDRIRAAVSSAFRAPTFNDLYWPDEGWAKGNPDLRPEKSINLEAGVDKQITEKINSSLTCFHNRFNNLINWMTDSSWVSMPSNIGSAEINGIELSNTLALTKTVSVDAAYTYQRPINRWTKKDLVYQPRHKASSSIAYAAKGLTCRLSGDFASTRFCDADNTMKAKQFFTLNFSLEKALMPNVDFLLNIDNLLDREYEVLKDYPAPGFAILAGVKVTF